MKKSYFEHKKIFAENLIKSLNKRYQRYTNIRTLIFFAVIFTWAAGYDYNGFSSTIGCVFYLACAVLVIGFIYMVNRHGKLQHNHEEALIYQSVINEYLERYDGKWREYEYTGQELLKDDNPQAVDLNLLGKASVFQYICSASTLKGRQKIVQRLSATPPPKEIIMQRQNGVNKLLRNPELVLKLQTLIYQLPDNSDITPLIENLKKNTLVSNTLRRSLIIMLPILTYGGILLSLLNLIPLEIGLSLFSLPLSISLIVRHQTDEQISPLYKLAVEMDVYSNIFSFLSEAKLISADSPAPLALRKLSSMAVRAEMRQNLFFFVIANTLFPLDLKMIEYFASWQKKYSDKLSDWMEIIYDTEANLSMAVIGMSKNSYCFPEILNSPEPIIKAKAITSLLLDGYKAVPNNIELKASTSIITGSNMSGKTTLLRTIAGSCILAYAGAPVLAEEFSLTPMQIFTSIRVNDDISQGISTFYAELLRIRTMIEYAKKQKPMLVCIDEIFKGTNSADRILGATEAIKKLSLPHSITMVSTHDFELCEIPAKENIPVLNYHFAEHYEDDKILFDYKIKDGRCTTTNARFLLKMTGITD